MTDERQNRLILSFVCFTNIGEFYCLSVISSTQNPVQLCYTIQHRTVLIIFLLILQTIIIAQMLSNRGEVGQTFVKVCIVFCNVKLWQNIEFRLITEGTVGLRGCENTAYYISWLEVVKGVTNQSVYCLVC